MISRTLPAAPAQRRALPRRAWPWVLLGGLLIAAVALVDVTITGPRVAVRWDADLTSDDRIALERRYALGNGEPDQGTVSTNTWRYELNNRSRENIRALLGDPAVGDTAYIDRDSLTVDEPDVRLSVRSLWYPFSDLFDRPSQLFRLHRSAWLLLAGGVLLWAARAPGYWGRRNVTVATLLLVGVIAIALPIDPSLVTMGEAVEHAESRDNFERYFAGRVRYEKHLSQTILLQIYQRLDPTEAAPERALMALSRLATAWFVLSALAIGFLERWSAVVLRYVALALLAPATLLYFGWREFGYLSLNVAVFPLLVRGLRDGGTRLEAASTLTGLGAALHGSGLVALAGAWLSALGASARLRDRLGRTLRVTAWGVAAYLGWVAIYMIVLTLPIAPDPGAIGVDPWRPWLVDEVREGRVSAAILSASGLRDVLMTAWAVGAPLLLVAVSLRRTYAHEVRTLWWYVVPSILFLVFRWPFQGIGGGMDLVVAGFPAMYALAWVCAQDVKRTHIAAALLVSAHVAFWRIVLDPRFEAVQIG